MKTSRKLLVVAAFLVAPYSINLFTAAGGRPREIKLPEKELASIPTRLGSWSGENVSGDPNLFNRAGSETYIDRRYRGPANQTMSVYVAAFANYVPDRGMVLPHSPETCYPANGYRIVDQQDVTLSSPKGASCSAKILAVERDRSVMYVCFWYQLGDRTFAKIEGMRDAVWALRGQKTWPPIVKVMLQADAPDARSARDEFKDLAGHLLDSLKEYR